MRKFDIKAKKAFGKWVILSRNGECQRICRYQNVKTWKFVQNKAIRDIFQAEAPSYSPASRFQYPERITGVIEWTINRNQPFCLHVQEN
jgi:hypothetical protein